VRVNSPLRYAQAAILIIGQKLKCA
jgi:hypothetical protein